MHPATNLPAPQRILEHAEDSELVKKAMDELPAEFREILVLRHQEGLVLQGDSRHPQDSDRVRSCRGSPAPVANSRNI